VGKLYSPLAAMLQFLLTDVDFLPPADQTNNHAQSLWRSMQEIRNSGSDWLKPFRFFFRCMKFAVVANSKRVVLHQK